MTVAPPLEYLITSSQTGLENFDLGRMNAIANLRKELGELVEEWIEAETQSRLARWILDCRRTQEASSAQDNSELSRILPAEENTPTFLPLSDAALTPNNCESLATPTPFSSSPSHPFRDLTASRGAFPLLRPKLSERAADALTFLEQRGRLETDAIGKTVQDPETGTDSLHDLTGSVEHPQQRQRPRKNPQMASLFPAPSESSQNIESARLPRKRFGPCSATKDSSPPRRHSTGSLSSTDLARVVPLQRVEKPSPAPPLRASSHYSLLERKAV